MCPTNITRAINRNIVALGNRDNKTFTKTRKILKLDQKMRFLRKVLNILILLSSLELKGHQQSIDFPGTQGLSDTSSSLTDSWEGLHARVSSMLQSCSFSIRQTLGSYRHRWKIFPMRTQLTYLNTHHHLHKIRTFSPLTVGLGL